MNLFNTNIKEEYLTKENILKYISEYDVYNYYVPGIRIGEVISSPFRRDSSPSFGIFIGKYNDIAFNDYGADKKGDFITFVSEMESCSRKDALSIINQLFDLKLVDYNKGITRSVNRPITTHTPAQIVKKKTPSISVKLKPWSEEDIAYWSPLDVSKLRDTLPIQYYWVDQQLFNTDKIAYAYRYGNKKYKVYQPMLKKGKWWSNIAYEDPWFGHKYLPNVGDLLIVASSNKDGMVLNQLGYNTIAPHSESQMFSEEQWLEYSARFSKIVVFYDNDGPGVKRAEKFCEKFPTSYIALEEPSTKDPFEYIKKYGLKQLNEWLCEILKKK